MTKSPQTRLGRGLAALLGDDLPTQDTERRHPDIAMLAVELLAPSPFQPRGTIEPDALAELTESVRARGILQPLLARPDPDLAGRYQIIAGERRWRAAQAAGLHEVPVLVRALSDSDAMAAALVENLQRQDLNAVEEAEGYRRLSEEFGLTQEKLGDAVGKSRSHIANTLRLLNLPSPVLHEVKKGALSAGHARALLSHADPATAMLTVLAKGLNVRQTEQLVARKNAPPVTAQERAARRDPEIAVLERDLSNHLGLKVTVTYDGQSGDIRIRYKSLDQLDGLITLLTR
ncbi:ParB/RepB/Spo0J family partition protein [Granulibacter bethesdensis]|uniref:Chromosome partitioning protein parB n=2 Tax=Granulibacter bethesdensis TaxID=364410 RepID=Q0BW96_GRABC|nr:ParB/RepB/Spo0J family partition protein [Granulibacter bethesdensis]ABI60906.1 Chromosome partitioning protein parB [Granulibacter bethesdensis CGDNIH1]AHJ61740.1 Chromosome partitioning protein parB [Granulibacter bethesdensis]AHJ64364.1 Chromosome partitioning protein parB [Granulibacter bethesdensis CGDNIH4]AHJ66987.1 Chromosome partitioning protein parB [Granulibacter bethesdensis]APH50667.1 Chromosome partitioning protein parB [Granulibacter bethesdensis]